MEAKNLTFLIASIFALVFLIGLTSAATIFSEDFDSGNLDDWTVTGWTNEGVYATSSDLNATELSRTISTSGFETITISYERELGADWESADFFKVSWSTDGSTFNTLEEVIGSSEDALPDDTDFISKTFTLGSSVNNNADFQLKFECTTNAQTEFCNLDNILVEGNVIEETEEWEDNFCIWDKVVSENEADLQIDIEDISVEGFGDDESWFPFDEIEVEVSVENDGDYDTENIQVEWGLYDSDNGEWVIDVDDEKEFDLKDGKDETLTFTFTIDDDMDVDLEDLEDGDQYVLYVRATGEIDDRDADEFDGDDSCAWDSEEIEIVIERDFVVVSNLEITETVSCGSNLVISGDAYNVGEDDQDEVTVLVQIKNLDYIKELKFDEIESFEKEKFDLTIPIPKNAEENSYSIIFEVYDEDMDIYENDFDDDESRHRDSFIIEGGCSGSVEEDFGILISANLQSGGFAGEPLVVNAMITNTGDEQATLLFNAAGYGGWANSADLNKATIILESGESDEITITFDVKKDISAGDKSFNLEVISDNELIASQPVSFSIQQKASGISDIFGDSWYLWLIGLLNVILVIIIIVVAVKVARK